MKGSVLILLLFIMAAASFLLLTAFSIMEAHFFVSQSDDLHQAAYYLAETGVNSAIAELTRVIEETHRECLSDFEWNPLNEPLQSLQESAGIHVANELGPKVQSRLKGLGYFSDFPVSLPPETNPQSKIKVRIYMPAVYANPAKLQIISIGTIGKVVRRMDAYLDINKVGHVYDSKVFDMVFLSGEGIDIGSGGSLQTDGCIYSQGSIQVDEQSSLDIQGKISTEQNIYILNGSTALFSQDMICRSLTASGSSGSTGSSADCLSDVYAYSTVEANGSGNTINIKGKLYIAPDAASFSAGVIAQDGSKITLEKDIFINGTLDYPASGQSFFTLKENSAEDTDSEESTGDISPEQHRMGSDSDRNSFQDGIFHSSESIGGNNQAFYFSGAAPEYAKNLFGPNYLSLDDTSRLNLLYEYLTKPPDTEAELPEYEAHTALLDKNSISLLNREPDSGYASGLIFSDGRTIRKNHLPQPEVFFQKILLEMEKQTSWNFINQLKISVSVPNFNVLIEGTGFTVYDPKSPVVYILPEEEDITLPAGEYSGILFTNGSIHVNQGDNVTFTGLMIAGGKLVVEGNLTIKEDKNLLLRLLDAQGGPLMSFFRISRELPLIQLQSCREHPYFEN